MPDKVYMLAIVAVGAGMATLGVAAAGGAMLNRSDASAGAVIKDVKGSTVGELRIEDAGDGRAKVTVTVTGLSPGFHGFHVHKKGVCDPKSTDPATGSPFFSAGPHFSLRPASHPNHSGDLPGLLVNANGKGSASYETDRFAVRQLLEDGGSAIIIHALPDNKANIPARFTHPGGGTGPDAESLKTGDSGARIACGVITRRTSGS